MRQQGPRARRDAGGTTRHRPRSPKILGYVDGAWDVGRQRNVRTCQQVQLARGELIQAWVQGDELRTLVSNAVIHSHIHVIC